MDGEVRCKDLVGGVRHGEVSRPILLKARASLVDVFSHLVDCSEVNNDFGRGWNQTGEAQNGWSIRCGRSLGMSHRPSCLAPSNRVWDL